MTPAELHSWLVARWTEHRALAQTALAIGEDLPEHLAASWYTPGALSGPKSDAGLPEPDAAFIIANPPAYVIAVCDAALRRLARHAPFDSSGELCKHGSSYCYWPCLEVLDDAAPWADRSDFPEELRRV